VALALALTAVPVTGTAVAAAADDGGVGIDAHRPRGEQRTESIDVEGADGATYIVRFADGTDAATGAQLVRDAGGTVYDTFDAVFPGAVVAATPAQLAVLRGEARIATVEADRLVTLAGGPDDAGTAHLAAVQGSPTWALDRIDQRFRPLSGTYEYAATGAGVTAYVLDSGVRGDHVDFGGRVLAGAWLQPMYTGPGDCHGHGTHVAGILGSNTFGVAKGVTIFPLRIFGCNGSASTSDVILGLNYVVDNHVAGQPAVLNLSIGGPANGVEDAAVQAVIDDGVTVVAAAGNDGSPACSHTPARVPAAITVAATNSADFSPDWSSWGTCVDVFAPGEAVLSLGNASTTATAVMSGTSMASPSAAGVAALMLQQNPSWSPARVAAQLTANATPNLVGNAGDGSPNRLLYSLPMPPTALASMTPARLLDTRPDSPTADGQGAGIGMRGAGWITELQITGRAGVPATATTASLNVTVTDAQAPGFVTVFPCGQPLPTASNLNYGPGDTIANAVITQIGIGGKVCLFTYAPTHLVADLNGYSPVGALYNALTPARLLDTRPGSPTADGGDAGIGMRGAGWITELQVAGRAGVPATATTASLNVTVTEARAPGFVTVYPCGQPVPTASNLNYGPGDTIPNAVVTQIGAGGKVCLFTYAPTHLIADINGYYPTGALYDARPPARLLDSRAGYSTVDGNDAGIGPRGAGWVTELQVAGRAGIPGDATTASLNVTATETQAPGFVTVYPCGQPVPTASNLNFAPQETIANAVITRIGAGGKVCLFTYAPTHLVVDVNGSFPAT
jgi:subtilisin family serine protease